MMWQILKGFTQKIVPPEKQPSARLLVALVVLELSVGGLERMVIQLANGLVARGISTRIIVMENEDNTLIGELEEGVEVFCLEGSLFSKLFQLRRLVRGHIIHLHFWGGHVRPWYRAALLWAGPLLNTYQNTYHTTRSRLWTLIDRLLNWQLRFSVCVSTVVRDYCVKEVGIPAAKICIIPNGVVTDTTTFSQTVRPDWTDRNIKLIFVARLVSQKDHPTLLRGIAVAKALGCDVRAILVGDEADPSEHYKDALIHLADELGISENVTWPGEVWEREEVKALCRQSDIYVTTSLWEGLPLAVLEAMAEGIPVIASNIGPHREVLAEYAAYFPCGDAQALGQAIVEVSRQYHQFLKLALSAHQRVRFFSMDKVLDDHVALYLSLCTWTGVIST